MKFKMNIYLLIAIAIIGAITGSLAMSLGEIEPAASAAIILVSVLVLGGGAGSVSSQAEIDRLTSIETAAASRPTAPSSPARTLSANLSSCWMRKAVCCERRLHRGALPARCRSP